MTKSIRALIVFLSSQFIFSIVAARASTEQHEQNEIGVKTQNNQKPNKESQKVIRVMELITRALAQRDFVGMTRFMDKGCTTFDEATGKVIVGRDKVIADVQQKLATQENLAHERITDFTIDQPFVRVNGNVATVSFVLIKEVAGTPPQKFESHCTDVFIKNGGDWKKLHYRGDNWKLIQ